MTTTAANAMHSRFFSLFAFFELTSSCKTIKTQFYFIDIAILMKLKIEPHTTLALMAITIDTKRNVFMNAL